MRSRIPAIFISVLLSLVLMACSSKPSNTTSDNSNAAPGASDNSDNANAQGERAGKVEKAKPEAKAVVVPAGTVLTVRLGNAVGSKISSPGQSFSGTLAQPIAVAGKQVIPAGANATGTVVDAKPLGRFKGGALLKIKLVSLSINGNDTQIETSSLTRTEKGKGKRTAVMAGGGAGLGALIGGLAGGGKGALIGAAAGGGAGTAGSAFTGNKEIVLPAESAVSFKLEQPLELK
jgi:hypothetical protein